MDEKITERDEDMWRSGFLAGLRAAIAEIAESDSLLDARLRVGKIPERERGREAT